MSNETQGPGDKKVEASSEGVLLDEAFMQFLHERTAGIPATPEAKKDLRRAIERFRTRNTNPSQEDQALGEVLQSSAIKFNVTLAQPEVLHAAVGEFLHGIEEHMNARNAFVGRLKAEAGNMGITLPREPKTAKLVGKLLDVFKRTKAREDQIGEKQETSERLLLDLVKQSAAEIGFPIPSDAALKVLVGKFIDRLEGERLAAESKADFDKIPAPEFPGLDRILEKKKDENQGTDSSN